MYQCTGNPEPADVEEIMRTMMNDSFETAYQRASSLTTAYRHRFVREPKQRPDTTNPNTIAGISSLKAEKGLALQDIIQGIYDFAQTVEFSSATRVYFLDQIAQVECVASLLPRSPLAHPADSEIVPQAPLVDGWE